MILLKINDIKSMMALLLLHENFDEFFVEEAEVVTFASFKINGRRNKRWYDTEELETDISDLLYWKEIKKMIFEFIKGQKTPETMKISLKASKSFLEFMMKENGCYEQYLLQEPEFYIQLRYEKENLTLVSGISYKEFTLDKSMEFIWDEIVKKWIKSLRITFEV